MDDVYSFHLHNEELKQSKNSPLSKNSVYISSFNILITELIIFH